MPDYAALKTALATGGAYAGMTDAQTFGLMVGPPPLFDSLQFSDPAKAAALNALITALVNAGLITSAAAQTIGALSQTLVSQASPWGWPGGIIENDLVAARAL